MKEGRSGIVRDGALAGAASVLMNAATFAYYLAVTRRFGPDEGGLLLSIFSTVLLAAMPAYVVGIALSRSLAQSIARAQTDIAFGVSRRILGVSALIGLAVIAGCALSGSWLRTFFHVDDPSIAFLIGFSIVGQSYVLLGRGIQQGLGRIPDFALSLTLEAITKGLASIVILTSLPSTALGLPAYTVALGIPAGMTALMVIWRTAGARRVTSVRGTLRESSAVIFAWIAIAMLTYYDSILARHVLSADQSGYYNAASLAGRALMTALAFVPTILLPKVAARKVAGVASQALGRTALAVTASVSLGAVVAFAVFPALIVKVIAGPQFLLAATLVPWYGVAAACLSLAGVIVAQRLGDEESGIGLAILFAAIAEVLVLTIFHGSAKIIVLEVLFGHALTLLVAMSFRNKREMGASSG